MNEDIIFFAFRYALGRKTGAVGIVVDYLHDHWAGLLKMTQKQITSEIKYAIKIGGAGMECDVREWKSLLNK